MKSPAPPLDPQFRWRTARSGDATRLEELMNAGERGFRPTTLAATMAGLPLYRARACHW